VSDRLITSSDSTVARYLKCYCCTCDTARKYEDEANEWDPACHNHGAHGFRGCVNHGVQPVNCDCGCGYKVVSA
jgi:hypothetical protein